MTAPRSVLLVTKNDFTSQRDGGSKRTAALVRSLRADGYVVDWVAVRPFRVSKRAERLALQDWVGVGRGLFATLRTMSLSASKWFSPSAALRLAALAREADYDCLIVDHSQLRPYADVVATSVKCMSMHNIESELLRNYASSARGLLPRLISRYESRRLASMEWRFLDEFDIVATVSDRDASILTEAGVSRGHVVVASNGVADEFFGVQGEPSGAVVFIAHLGWRPNIDAATWLVNRVWPLVSGESEGFALQLIGRDPSKTVRGLQRKGVTVHADVESVLPYLQSASVATAPLLSAGGTRIKILEALAAGVPVVATTLGALGLDHLAAEHFLIVDDEQEFAEAVRKLAHGRHDRESVRTMVETYRWESSLAPLVHAISEHTRGQGART